MKKKLINFSQDQHIIKWDKVEISKEKVEKKT
jgi:hypothetical protein